MNTLPTEYFGPHAKRWTHPDTGVTYSLKPRDYHQLVAEQKEEELRDEAASAAWDDKALDAEDVLIVDGGFRTPEHQRYEMEVESSPVTVPPEMAGQFDAIVYGATRGGIKYPEMIDRNQAETKQILAKVNDDLSALRASGDDDMTVEGSDVVQRGRVRFLSLVEDDTFGSIIRPVEQQRPAGRHWRHRRPQRIARWFAKFGRHPRLWVATGLVYIIAVIGVAAVTGVIS